MIQFFIGFPLHDMVDHLTFSSISLKNIDKYYVERGFENVSYLTDISNSHPHSIDKSAHQTKRENVSDPTDISNDRPRFNGRARIGIEAPGGTPHPACFSSLQPDYRAVNCGRPNAMAVYAP
jgi:hypothetical protein